MMLFPGKVRFFLYAHPTDMRKSFDGLCGLVSDELLHNPLSGDVYIFINRRRDRIKILVWGGDGYWIYYKRLEKGTFQLPEIREDSTSLELSYESLFFLLEGIELRSVKKRKRIVKM